MSKSLEHCSECDCLTGNAGRYDGSVFVEFVDGALRGPLCAECAVTVRAEALDSFVSDRADLCRRIEAELAQCREQTARECLELIATARRRADPEGAIEERAYILALTHVAEEIQDRFAVP